MVRVGAHAARVGALVILIGALVILYRGHRDDVFAVDERLYGHFLAF